MPKYTKEFKIKLVLEYLSVQIGGRPAIANKYNIPDSTLENWINKYNSGGFDNLSKKLNNNKFTSEFKLTVIQYRQPCRRNFRWFWSSYRATKTRWPIFKTSKRCRIHRWHRQDART